MRHATRAALALALILAACTPTLEPSPTPQAVVPILEPEAPPEFLPLPSSAQESDPPAVSSDSGWATYCAPTPTRCQRWGGDAHLGAVPSFSYGDTPYRVLVRYGDRRTIVLVVSYCACGDRHGQPTVIDLSPAAFDDLAPLSLGVIRVTVEAPGPSVTLPPTDVP